MEKNIYDYVGIFIKDLNELKSKNWIFNQINNYNEILDKDIESNYFENVEIYI